MERNCNSCKKGAFFPCDTLLKNEAFMNIEKMNFVESSMERFKFKSEFICDEYACMYIEYPIEVSKINHPSKFKSHNSRTGKLVKIQPCAERFEGKTYLGIYLGDLPVGVHITHDAEKELSIKNSMNPAIFVFGINEIIYGMESWWGVIESEDELKQITTEDINDIWYVKLLKEVLND